MLGIVAAMDLEIENLRQSMQNVEKHTFAQMDYYVGMLCGTPAVIAECGVGKVNAALHTQIMIDRFGIDHLIHTGIAGSLSPELKILSVVIGQELMYHDMQQEIMLGFAPFRDRYASDPALLALAAEAAGPQCHIGRIATGDVFVAEKKIKDEIATRCGALCVEMEGAAVAHTAYVNGIPFVVIRCISDMADDGAVMDYTQFQHLAADKAAGMVRQMAAKLTEQSCL